MKKTIRNLNLYLIGALFTMSLLACSSSSSHNPPDEMNIVETVIDDGNFTTLVAALEAAELDDDLQGDGPFTVFAPTDAAFDLLPAGTVDFLLQPANQATLVDILTYHVFSGELIATDVIDRNATSIAVLNGKKLSINIVDGKVILNLGGNREAMVTTTDVEASNGVIHVIDVVLDPGDERDNVVETAISNGNFTTLVAALQAAELDDDLQGTGPITVFAPTDAAFGLLPAGTVDFLLQPANQSTLIDILTYHVFSGGLLADDVLIRNGTSLTMLNGSGMSINVEEASVILNSGGGREAAITITDVLCSNGVIHVIDVVLDPADTKGNIVDVAVGNGSFTTLVAALQAVELDDDLQGAGPFTVFAPTDDAFGLLPAGTVDSLLEPANKATLTDILLYHVFSGAILAADAVAADGSRIDMLNNGNVAVDVAGGEVILNMGGNRQATVIITDILASNGVIHVIDRVLDPEDTQQ